MAVGLSSMRHPCQILLLLSLVIRYQWTREVMPRNYMTPVFASWGAYREQALWDDRHILHLLASDACKLLQWSSNRRCWMWCPTEDWRSKGIGGTESFKILYYLLLCRQNTSWLWGDLYSSKGLDSSLDFLTRLHSSSLDWRGTAFELNFTFSTCFRPFGMSPRDSKPRTPLASSNTPS